MRLRRTGAARRTRRPILLHGTTIGMSANRLLRGQLSYMREQGWDVHLATTPGPDLELARDREGFTAHPLRMSRDIDPLQDLLSLARWLRLLAALRPAVTNMSTPKAALLGSIAAFVTRVPKRVYVVRGLRLEGTEGGKRKLLALLERLTILLSTDVVAVSHSLAATLREHRLVGAKREIHVLGAGSSNGVDAEAVRAAASSEDAELLRKELGVDGRVVVGYLGRISADKGLDTLADAISRPPLADAPGWVLLCVGGVEDHAVLDILRRNGDRVVHVDHTSEPWKHLAAMDVLCLPTRREGFPNVVLEAGALGIPTVSTDATGAVDAVRDGETGLTVAVDDAAGLSSALSRLVQDGELRSRMGSTASRWVREDFRPERIWAELDALYRGAPDEE